MIYILVLLLMSIIELIYWRYQKNNNKEDLFTLWVSGVLFGMFISNLIHYCNNL